MSKTTISKEALLNRFQASIYLNEVYELYLDINGLIDNLQPDFYSILIENARDSLSLSAVAKGLPHGNRGGYGFIEFIRILGRPHYFRHTLEAWFTSKFAPRLI